MMSRVLENEAVRKQVDAQLNDTELAAAIMIDVDKAVPVALACLIPIIFDISKSLAVIADKVNGDN